MAITALQKGCKSIHIHQINMISTGVGEAAGQCGRCLPMEQHCCVPMLTCGLKVLSGIHPSPLPALQEAGGIANPPEHHVALTVQAQSKLGCRITLIHLLPPLLFDTSTPPRACTFLYAFCSSRGLKMSLGELCPQDTHQQSPMPLGANSNSVQRKPSQPPRLSLMPSLLGSPP